MGYANTNTSENDIFETETTDKFDPGLIHNHKKSLPKPILRNSKVSTMMKPLPEAEAVVLSPHRDSFIPTNQSNRNSQIVQEDRNSITKSNLMKPPLKSVAIRSSDTTTKPVIDLTPPGNQKRKKQIRNFKSSIRIVQEKRKKESIAAE